MRDQNPNAHLAAGAVNHPTTGTNSALTKRECQELDACKLSFTIVWKGRKQPRIDDTFYSWSRRAKTPYVRIHYRHSRAYIFMDLPNASGSLDIEGMRELRALCLNYGFECDSIKSTHPIELPTEQAEVFAKRLVEIGLGFCGRYLAEHDAA